MIRELKREDLEIKIDLKEGKEEDKEDKLGIEEFHQRAVNSLKLALEVDDPSYNVFVVARKGYKIEDVVRSVVEDIAKHKTPPDDWIYVYNFKDPSRPIAINLPNYIGERFKKDVEVTIRNIKQSIRQAMESEAVIKEKERLLRELQKKKEEVFSEIRRKARELGFQIQEVHPGVFNIIPIIGNEIILPHKYDILPESVKSSIESKRVILEEYISQAMKEIISTERSYSKRIEEIEKSVAEKTISPHFEDLEKEYIHYPKVIEYLKDMRQDILENLQLFLEENLPKGVFNPLRRYEVNHFVRNTGKSSAPIVIEKNPSYYNLFGRVEKEALMGALITDFMYITPGSLHLANGGYIIINAYDLLKEPFSYEALKKTIKNGEIVIEDVGEKYSLISSKTLRPEPIPFKAKVILIGEPMLYYLLYYFDPEFADIFKVKADTEPEAPISKIEEYTKILRRYIPQNVDIKSLIETLFLHEDDRKKIPLNIEKVEQLVKEAKILAEKEGKNKIDREILKKSIEAIEKRNSLQEERMRELIERNYLLVDVEGEKIGEVNGLFYLSVGGHSFGMPTKITASVGLGREGIIDIERETGLGGKIHTKAVLIIGGFILGRYGKKVPISFQARLTFEQSYSGVEGDSASVAESLAILSEIGSIPIKQNIAITGSMNQKGDVQPVGGVKEKIIGFWKTLKIKNKEGGVIIPSKNFDNVILPDEILEDIEKGKFKIWTVDKFDDVIEIATGLKPEEFDKKVLDGFINFVKTQSEIRKKIEDELKKKSEEKSKKKKRKTKKEKN